MNPEQQNGQYQPAPQAPQNGNPYEFIMNPGKPPKPPTKLLPTGNSTLQRALIFGGGVFVVIVLIIIIGSALSKSGQKSTNELIAVAQEQTELARIANDGTINAKSQATRNLAGNVLASMTSAQAQTVEYLQKNHHKVGTKTLALKQDAAADTTLLTAKEAGTYDSAFTGIIQQDLNAYAASLKKAFDAKPGPEGKALLNAQYQAAQLLNKQSQQN
jgi:hypothetical protein